MRITLLTMPGRGDTEPFIALALGLMRHGHTVKLASRPDFASLVTGYGVDFAPMGNPYQPFITGAAEASAVGSGHRLNQLRYGLRQRKYVTENLQDDAWHAAQGAEAIIYKYPWLTAHTIAEKLDIPCAPAMLLPFEHTRSFPSFMLGRGIDRGPLLNRLVWSVPWQLVWQGLRLDDKKLRRKLELHPLPIYDRAPLVQRGPMPIFGAWSPSVLPRPSDWPERIRVTGYWFLDPPPGWQPPSALVEFLDDGLPPVCIGFGSMASGDRDATLKLVLEALERSGQRGVLLSGWAGLGEKGALPGNVFVAESIPHSWLFPRVAAVVHHGGAGTTGAGLRFGVPSVITPVLADQPSWAQVVHRLGTGPAPIPFEALTAERLADGIGKAVGDPMIRKRAAAIGEQIRGEDGVGRTIELFSEYLETSGRS
jgi:sterol 3beta-glucosyltransferase